MVQWNVLRLLTILSIPYVSMPSNPIDCTTGAANENFVAVGLLHHVRYARKIRIQGLDLLKGRSGRTLLTMKQIWILGVVFVLVGELYLV